MIKIEKKMVVGLETDYDLYSKKKEDLKKEKNVEKNTLLDKMKNIDFEEVVVEFTNAMAELDAKYEKKSNFYERILAECFEDVEVEYPDEDGEVIEENTETVE